MRGIVLGTGGHVDHGKTALVRALTGVDTDRWKEEKKRGLTIDIGFARLELDDETEAGIVDVPGHEDFLKNMLAGATGIDLLLLVVAADEGPMPQTAEHLAIARLLGVERGIVVLTKSDRVEEEWLELVRAAAAEEVAGALDGASWPSVAVSSTTGGGVEELRALIRSEVAETRPRSSRDLFRLPVDRSFSVRGTGTVVTGTVWSGRVSVGDAVRLLPIGRIARVRSLQVHGEGRAEVAAGRRCALALVGVEPREVPRGTVVVADETWRSSRRLGVRLRLLRQARSLEHGQRVRVYHATREVMARVLLPRGRPLSPGEDGWALLRLEGPVIARARDRVVLRFYSPVVTIGGGEVAEVDPPPRWRERRSAWRQVLDGSPEEALRAVLELRRGTGADFAELPLLTGRSRAVVSRWKEEPPDVVIRLGERFLLARDVADLRAYLLASLDRLHAERPRASCVSKEAWRAGAGRRFAPSLVDHVVELLAAAGEVVLQGPGARLPDHRPRLTREERELREILLARIEDGGLEPLTVEELAGSLQADRDILNDLLVLLKEEGAVVALTPELYVAAETAQELAKVARRLLAERPVASTSLFKEALGVTRKYLIPALEYLDRVGVTRRTEEGRELVP
ncbi:MAG: selenocysteine-specific translation elongation factor [Gemmatimonadota bacterium]